MAKDKAFKKANTNKSKKGLIYFFSFFFTVLLVALTLGAMTMAAQIREYHISFSNYSSYQAPIKIKKGDMLDLDALEIKTPLRTGYTFVNWKMYANGKDEGIYTAPVKVKSSIYFLSQWTANTYTVTLNPMGGVLANTSIQVTYNKLFNIKTLPTKTGFTFGGWYDAANGDGKMYVNGSGTGELVYNKHYNSALYAKWTAVQ